MQESEKSNLLRDTIVVANPGTGKTWEIVERVMKILKSGVPGDEIVCVTFTNKAADEMKNRILLKAKEHPDLFDQALRIVVSTIHAYAMEYLRTKGINAKITSNTVLRYTIFNKLQELNTFDYGQSYLIETIVPKIETGIRYLKSFGIVPSDINSSSVIQLFKEKIHGSRSSNLTDKALNILVKDFITIFEAYEDFKKQEGSMDYDDLLRIFIENMDDRRGKHVLVDEFQDLNRMQVDIVGRLGETRFFVGDRKQSIFGFQGGSLSSFNKYLQDSSFNILGKNINHRSTNNILNYAASYFLAYSKDEYSRKEIQGLSNPEKGEGQKVSLITSGKQTSDAVGVLQKIFETEKESEKSIAIIARTNSQITEIAENLDTLGITYSSTIRNKVNQSQIDSILTYISGLVSNEPDVVSKALLTPFSGLTLMEAVEIQGKLKKNGLNENQLPSNFRELRELKFGIELVEEAFNRIIFPIATSIGHGYINSANLTLQSAREYLSVFPDYSLKGYLDFMTLSSEQVEADLRESRVNILTVHKAKGLEFDTVIYIPSEPTNRLEYFDALTASVIKTSIGIDVQLDLQEEPLRVDFVALTRAQEKLVIVANNKLYPRFQLNNNFYEESAVDVVMEPGRSGRYDEAYMMFVNGRYEEAKDKLNGKNKWLVEAIREYFTGVEKLSYTVLEAVHDPYKFLREYILKVRDTSPYTQRGTSFHEVAHRYASGSLKPDEIPEDIMQDFSNMEQAINILETDYSTPPKYSELTIELPLSSIFPDMGAPDNISLKGTIDAIFLGRNETGKHLIADYKTSRKVDSKYWHQLWLYTRMYRKKYGITPESISGGVIYVGLRETINTGNRGYDVQVRDYYKIKTSVVEDRLKEFLLYTNQPETFVENLLSKPPKTEFEERLREVLEKSF